MFTSNPCRNISFTYSSAAAPNAPGRHAEGPRPLQPRALPAVASSAEYLEVAHGVRSAPAVGDDVVELYLLRAAALDAPAAVTVEDGLLHGPRYRGARRLVRGLGAAPTHRTFAGFLAPSPNAQGRDAADHRPEEQPPPVPLRHGVEYAPHDDAYGQQEYEIYPPPHGPRLPSPITVHANPEPTVTLLGPEKRAEAWKDPGPMERL